MDDQTNFWRLVGSGGKAEVLRFLYLCLGVGMKKWWETENGIYMCMRQVLIRSIYSIEGSVRMPLARSASAADCLVYNLAARFTSFSSAVD